MAHLTMTAEHTLPKEEALRRLKEKLVDLPYRGRVDDLYEAWRGDTLDFRFKAVGMKVSGSLTVDDSEVRLTAKVPFAVMLLKRTIEKTVRAELGTLLD